MNKIGLQKELDYLLLAKNNIWTIFVANSAGTLGLLFLPSSILKWVLFPLGFILSFIFFDNYLSKDAKIEYIIKKLKEGDKYDRK